MRRRHVCNIAHLASRWIEQPADCPFDYEIVCGECNSPVCWGSRSQLDLLLRTHRVVVIPCTSSLDRFMNDGGT